MKVLLVYDYNDLDLNHWLAVEGYCDCNGYQRSSRGVGREGESKRASVCVIECALSLNNVMEEVKCKLLLEAEMAEVKLTARAVSLVGRIEPIEHERKVESKGERKGERGS